MVEIFHLIFTIAPKKLKEFLANKILIDCPDDDSAIAENQTWVVELGKIADVVLYITTQEKYKSRKGFDTIKPLFRRCSIHFIVNQCDKIDASDRSALEQDVQSFLSPSFTGGLEEQNVSIMYTSVHDPANTISCRRSGRQPPTNFDISIHDYRPVVVLKEASSKNRC